MIARLADGSPVGAWMLKARPDVWDIGTALEQGLSLNWWRLAHSYRADLVADGHPCVMWITRGDARTPSGIWGYGRVVGEPFLGTGDSTDPLWIDTVAQAQVRPRIQVEIVTLSEPIRREEIAADPRLAGLEILRVPRIGNPASASPQEWQVIRSQLSTV